MTKIRISFELEMTPENLKDWANEYGLDLAEASSDATGHLGDLVRAAVKGIMQVEDFATLRNYHVR